MRRVTCTLWLLLLLVSGFAQADSITPLGAIAPGKQAVQPPPGNAKTADSEQDELGDKITSSNGSILSCDWSPDGDTIVYGEDGEIFIVPSGGGIAINLTRDIDDYCYLPSFAPDNSGVIFTAYNNTDQTYSVMFTDFLGLLQQKLVENAITYAISPDGRYYVYRDSNTSELKLHDLVLKKTRPIAAGDYNETTGLGFGNSCFTPDGEHVITSKVVGDGQRLFQIAIDGSESKQITWHKGIHNHPDVSPDGRWVLYTSTENVGGVNNFHLYALDTETGRSSRMFANPPGDTFMGHFGASPDEFCYVLGDEFNWYEVFTVDFLSPEPGSFLSLLGPNGGETFTTGNEIPINWDYDGVEAVRIEYSADGGNHWKTIAPGVPAEEGGFMWAIPPEQSTECLIRISDSSGSGARAQTQSYFTITNSGSGTDEFLDLTSPNGGESFYSGQEIDITWDSAGISTFIIYFSQDNGIGWSTLADNVNAADGTFSIELPQIESETCIIKLEGSSTAGTMLSDQNNLAFVLLPKPYLRLSSPNGGEEWFVGKEYHITWESRDVGTIKIEYSTDGGNLWKFVADGVSAETNSFVWAVPDTPSQNCKVRITDENYDEANALTYGKFTIGEDAADPYLRLVAPNGGEAWDVGSTRIITWQARDVSTVRIELSRNDGVDWDPIASNVDASKQSYSWEVPSPPSAQCRVRITSEEDSGISYTSYAKFTIAPKPFIRVESPNGGEALAAGATYEIKWHFYDIDKFNIEYSTTPGSWMMIAENVDINIGLVTGTFDWQVPDDISEDCRIRVSDASGSGVSDISDGNFSIDAEAPEKSIVINQPAAGVTLVPGTTYEIEWTSTGIQRFDIEYSTDNMASWNTVVAGFVPSNTVTTNNVKAYVWTVPDADSDKSLIRILDADDRDFFRQSPLFTIRGQQQEDRAIQVTAPNGGEVWNSGETYPITWESSGLENVTIWFTDDSGVNWYYIVQNIPASNGSHDWQIPVDLVGETCHIAVGDPNDDQFYDVSDNAFSIKKSEITRVVVIHSPVGGETIIAGEQTTITWESLNVDNVDIYYSIDGAEDHIAVIAENVDASRGEFVWTVPGDQNINSPNCYIYFMTAGTTDVVGLNFNPFTITTESSDVPIEVLSPLAGSSFDAGTPAEIRWNNDSTVSFVGIEYSIDGGANWRSIANRVDAGTGSFSWMVPDQAVSNDCKIKVYNADDMDVSAESGIFTVHENPANVNALLSLDTNFATAGVQHRDVVGIGANQRVGFAAWSVDWRTSSSYEISFRWDSAKATFLKSASRISLDGQTMAINGQSVTLPDIDNILADGDASVSYDILTDNPGEFTAQIKRTSIGVSRLKNAFLYFAAFETDDRFVSGDSLKVRVDVRVTDKLGVKKALSPRFFKVYANPSERLISLKSPNGGESWNVGSEQPVIWQSDGVMDVKLEYSTDNGDSWTIIVDRTDATANDFLWQIPQTGGSDNCLVRITDANDDTLSDQSDAVFSLVEEAFIQVTAPSNGDKWREGSEQTIRWSALNVETLNIEYSTDGGAQWDTVAENISATDGEYSWTVPRIESQDCMIRITDAADGDPFAEMEGRFSITTSDYVTVTAPAAGDRWTVDTGKNINWELDGVERISIQISYDDGETWEETIADNIDAFTGSYQWMVPDKPSEFCRIKVFDTKRPDEVYYVTDLFVILKPELTIAHAPTAVARENEEINFTATVTSTAEIKSVDLYYNQMGQSEGAVKVVMEETGENQFSYSLPLGIFVAPGIEYYIEATDANNITARSPVDVGVHVVSAKVEDVNSTQQVSAGTEQSAYRMISIPLNLTSTSIADQLKETLPVGAQGTEWRLFRYPAGSSTADEYPDIEGFAPGRAFWLISTTAFTLKAPEGTTVATDEPFTLTLKSGWNDIANPWMFDIYWSGINNPGNAELSALYSYDGKWSDPTRAPDKMEPWKGYAVKNMESSDRIVFLNIGSAAKPASPVPDTEVWRISIGASAGQALDTANHLGVHTASSGAWDRRDHVEPPGIGEYVQVYFPHQDWTKHPGDYTVDFRPPESTLTWDFVVRTNIAGEMVDVELDGVSSLPDGAHLTLIDRDMNETITLDGAGFSFLSKNGITERHFTLAVSDGEYPGTEPVTRPGRFLTATAFPNPFNPMTTLRYELSHPGQVTLKVFNAVGQTIVSYDFGKIEAGLHEYVFDAENLTSGPYIYRIDTGYATVTGKMLYLK